MSHIIYLVHGNAQTTISNPMSKKNDTAQCVAYTC